MSKQLDTDATVFGTSCAWMFQVDIWEVFNGLGRYWHRMGEWGNSNTHRHTQHSLSWRSGMCLTHPHIHHWKRWRHQVICDVCATVASVWDLWRSPLESEIFIFMRNDENVHRIGKSWGLLPSLLIARVETTFRADRSLGGGDRAETSVLGRKPNSNDKQNNSNKTLICLYSAGVNKLLLQTQSGLGTYACTNWKVKNEDPREFSRTLKRLGRGLGAGGWPGLCGDFKTNEPTQGSPVWNKPEERWRMASICMPICLHMCISQRTTSTVIPFVLLRQGSLAGLGLPH